MKTTGVCLKDIFSFMISMMFVVCFTLSLSLSSFAQFYASWYWDIKAPFFLCLLFPSSCFSWLYSLFHLWSLFVSLLFLSVSSFDSVSPAALFLSWLSSPLLSHISSLVRKDHSSLSHSFLFLPHSFFSYFEPIKQVAKEMEKKKNQDEKEGNEYWARLTRKPGSFSFPLILFLPSFCLLLLSLLLSLLPQVPSFFLSPFSSSLWSRRKLCFVINLRL